LQHCHQRLSVLHNYFNGPKIADLYLAKFLDTSAKLFFFPYMEKNCNSYFIKILREKEKGRKYLESRSYYGTKFE